MDTHFNMHEPNKHYAEWKKPVMKEHILCDSIHVKYPEKANLQRLNRLLFAQYWVLEWDVAANEHKVSF